MADIDLDLDGVGELDIELSRLKDFGTTNAIFETGTEADYAVSLEFGRGPIEAPEGSAIPIETDSGETIFRKRVSGHPPYPFFRPAIREFQANPQTFVVANTDYNSIEEIPTATKLVEAVAVALQTKMEANVNAQKAGSRSPGTDPEHPKRDTGNLTASIQAVRIR